MAGPAPTHNLGGTPTYKPCNAVPAARVSDVCAGVLCPYSFGRNLNERYSRWFIHNTGPQMSKLPCDGCLSLRVRRIQNSTMCRGDNYDSQEHFPFIYTLLLFPQQRVIQSFGDQENWLKRPFYVECEFYFAGVTLILNRPDWTDRKSTHIFLFKSEGKQSSTLQDKSNRKSQIVIKLDAIRPPRHSRQPPSVSLEPPEDPRSHRSCPPLNERTLYSIFFWHFQSQTLAQLESAVPVMQQEVRLSDFTCES